LEEKKLNLPYLDNKFWQVNNTHKKILFLSNYLFNL
jgi:hypothetical protein